MKVKNIMFSGVMAAILGATAAQADPVQLISKTYADNNLQKKLTQTNNAGDNVTISEDGKIGVNLANYATTGAVDTAINNAVTSDTGVIKTVIDGVQADVDALDEKVGELPGTTEAKTIVEYIDTKTAGIATEGAMTQLGNRVTTVEDSLKEGGETANAIAAALTAGQNAQSDVDAVEKSLADNDTIAKANEAAVKSEVDAALELKANAADVYAIEAADAKFIDTTEIQNYATDAELAAVSEVADAAQTADEVSAAIDAKITDLDLANKYDAKGAAEAAKSAANTYADGLNTAMDTRVGALEAIDHTKFAEKTAVEGINTRLQTAEGEIDALQNATANLDDFIDETEIQAYATTEALAGVNTTAEKGVTDAAAAKAAADEAQADADANATAIEGKVDSIGAGKAGRYFIDFDDEGNVTYTQVTII